MSVFSELLEEILTEKDIKISQLAKMTGISPLHCTTMYMDRDQFRRKNTLMPLRTP